MTDSPEDGFGQGQSQPDTENNLATQSNAAPTWCPVDRSLRHAGWCGRPERPIDERTTPKPEPPKGRRNGVR